MKKRYSEEQIIGFLKEAEWCWHIQRWDTTDQGFHFTGSASQSCMASETSSDAGCSVQEVVVSIRSCGDNAPRLRAATSRCAQYC